jgi:predicted TIM-barrel fold metal-dependent hydrolase
LVWGTDWPHPPGHLLDLFNEWTPDAAVRRKILVDNPAGLCGFPA